MAGTGLRIGLVVPGFSAHPADWCIPALRHLVRRLAATDDVRVVAVRYPYERARYVVDGADVCAIGGAERRGRDTLQLWRETLHVLRAEHRHRPFDVLHAFWATESGLLAAIAGRLLRVPTLVSLAGGELVGLRDISYGDQRVAWERVKVRASLQLATAVTAGSALLRELASRHVARERLYRAPLGVDTLLFNPSEADVPGDGQRVVYVGTLVPVKDQATLLRAFAQIDSSNPPDSPPVLEIVGDGPLRSDLGQLARELGIAERVCLRGAIDHAALPSVYHRARALVVSSRHEAQCMAALEAAACGVPVVGTRVGIVPEVTRAVVPIGDSPALASAIAATLADRHDTQALVERVQTDFGLETCTARFRELYQAIA